MNSLLLDISTLYRESQKYLDRHLKSFSLGAGQFLFILAINENEGLTMQELTQSGNFDKGTTSKTIQKLEEEGYIVVKNDEIDRRIKRLYTSDKALAIMSDLYQIRKNCCDNLLLGLNRKTTLNNVKTMTENTRLFINQSDASLKLGGLQKISLVDYPNEVACTVFTSGCNFKCPFCHNKDLVFVPTTTIYYDESEILNYLGKRKGVLGAVCISGGEPCLQNALMEFIITIKKMGYKVKLDTNGYYPEHLATLIQSGYIDYVAMDIKNCKEKYAQTIGLDPSSFDISKIEASIELIKNSGIDYEFRTTVVNELHGLEDIEQISIWIKDARQYYLQIFKESENVIAEGFSSPSEEFMHSAKIIAHKNVVNTSIRGGN